MKLPVRIKSLLRKVHLLLSLASCAPLLVLAITGALLVFPHWLQDTTSSIDHHVQPQEKRLSVDELVAAMNAALPADDPAHRIVFPESDDWVVTATTKQNRSIIINPYDGEVRHVGGNDSSWYPFLVRLHASLLMGKTGTWITGLSALAMMLLSMTGIALWWPVGEWNRSYFLISWKRGDKRFNYDLHRATGLYSSILLLLLGVTGVAMVFHSVVEPIVMKLTGSTPLPDEPKKIEVPADGRRIAPSQAVAAAQQQMPNGKLYRLYYPTEPSAPYRVFLNPPESFRARYSEARFVVDSYSGKVIYESSDRTRSRGDAVMMWILPLHFGTFGGLTTQVLYLFGTLAPVVLVITGLKLYLGRRAKQQKSPQAKITKLAQAEPVAQQA